MKKLLITSILAIFPILSNAQTIVNEQCVTNLVVMEGVSENISYDSKWLLRLIEDHFWVGAENRKELITEITKYRDDYKSNYDFIFNNKKKDIVNNFLKQECLSKTGEKIKEANNILKEVRILKTALLLTIANTSNILKKNDCNVEEACSQELNDDFMARVKLMKETEEKKLLSLEEKSANKVTSKTTSASKKGMVRKGSSKLNHGTISVEDVKICY